MKKVLGSILGFVGLSQMALAAPVVVDLADAETSLTNVGTAMIGIAVAILGTILVLKFLRRG